MAVAQPAVAPFADGTREGQPDNQNDDRAHDLEAVLDDETDDRVLPVGNRVRLHDLRDFILCVTGEVNPEVAGLTLPSACEIRNLHVAPRDCCRFGSRRTYSSKSGNSQLVGAG